MGKVSEREPDYSAEMRLPEGKTCGDCVHGRRCDMLFGAVRRKFTSCDFWPSKFAPTRRAIEEGGSKPPRSMGEG